MKFSSFTALCALVFMTFSCQKEVVQPTPNSFEDLFHLVSIDKVDKMSTVIADNNLAPEGYVYVLKKEIIPSLGNEKRGCRGYLPDCDSAIAQWLSWAQPYTDEHCVVVRGCVQCCSGTSELFIMVQTRRTCAHVEPILG